MTISDLPLGPVVPVRDLARSRRFYEGSLGFTGRPAAGGWELTGRGTIYLLESTDYPGVAAWPLVSFRTTDVDATAAELRDRGVALEHIPDGPQATGPDGIADMGVMRICWVRDPDEQVLSFYQPTPDAGPAGPTDEPG